LLNKNKFKYQTVKAETCQKKERKKDEYEGYC
jgi:hypothetical protein